MLETAEDYLPTSGFSCHESEAFLTRPAGSRFMTVAPATKQDLGRTVVFGSSRAGDGLLCSQLVHHHSLFLSASKVLEKQPELRWKLSRQAEAERW